MGIHRDSTGRAVAKAGSLGSPRAHASNNASTVREGVKRIAYAGRVYEKTSGYVWCDKTGGVHEDSLNPYDMIAEENWCNVEDHFPVYTEDPGASKALLRAVERAEEGQR